MPKKPHLFTWVDVNRIVVRSGIDIYNEVDYSIANSMVGFVQYLMDRYKRKTKSALDLVREALIPLENLMISQGFPGKEIADIGFYIAAKMSGYTDDDLKEAGYDINLDTFLRLIGVSGVVSIFPSSSPKNQLPPPEEKKLLPE